VATIVDYELAFVRLNGTFGTVVTVRFARLHSLALALLRNSSKAVNDNGGNTHADEDSSRT
jgi:hypothetical protein